MRDLRGDVDDVAGGESLPLPALDRRPPHLVGRGGLGAHHLAAKDERRLAARHHEQVRLLLVQLGLAVAFAVRDHREVVGERRQALRGHLPLVDLRGQLLAVALQLRSGPHDDPRRLGGHERHHRRQNYGERGLPHFSPPVLACPILT